MCLKSNFYRLDRFVKKTDVKASADGEQIVNVKATESTLKPKQVIKVYLKAFLGQLFPL